MAEPTRSPIEEESLAALAATEVGPRTARWMSWLFVAILLSVPLLQAAIEVSRRQLPQPLALLRPVPASARQAADGHLGAAWQALQPLLSADALHAFEEDLQRQSLLRQRVQPRLQALLAIGGFGNSECVLGRNGWLFHQPGLEYLAGPSLLDPHQLQVRARKQGVSGPSHPDPRPAILQLHRDCARAGLRLVLVPVPDKSMIQPAQLSRRLQGNGTLARPNNSGYQQLVQELRSRSVEVFDPTPDSLLPEEERYLRHDTHWTPAFMEETALRLGYYLLSGPFPAVPRKPLILGLHEKQVSRPGDLLAMLRLPREQSLFPSQSVTIHPVVDIAAHRYWRPDPESEVVLLGDSFTNIYSDGEGDEGLGWGRSAGLAAHLSRWLGGRPLDVIARNGGGATQARAELMRRPHPLHGKRVLIWQFAIRELALGDWKPLPLPTDTSAQEAVAGERADGRLVVEATIVATSRTPAPSSVPYRSCLTFMKVRIDRVVQGRCSQDQVIAAFWGLRENQIQPAASYAAGDHFRLTLVPLARAASQLQSVRCADDLNDYEHPTYFVEECSR